MFWSYEGIASAADVLTETTFCKHFGAKKIQYKPKGLFCSDGEILLVHNRMPMDLYDLLTIDSDEGKYFKTHGRAYNNTFSLASFIAKCDKEVFISFVYWVECIIILMNWYLNLINNLLIYC